ncbi:MAG: DUF4886 domain-containing protein [Bacilli bacterium]
MKNKNILILIIMLFFIVLSGCNVIEQKEEQTVLIVEFEEEISINEPKLMKVHSTLINDVFTFKSSDESIVIVDDNGLVLGVNIGNATITVTSISGVIKNHSVTVNPIVYVESISLEIEEKDSYYPGIPYHYDIKFMPENASNKSIKFSHPGPYVTINEVDKTITFNRACNSSIFVYLKDEWKIQDKVDIDVKYSSNSNIYDLLFVGNSLTKYTYDIPSMVKQMIEKDGSIVYVDYSTDFQYLDQHEFNIDRSLDQNKYTHVILQEKSDGLQTDFNRFKQSVLKCNEMIIANGAKTVLYQTWAYNYASQESKNEMHDIVSEGYKSVGSEINSLVALVGEIFMEIMKSNPEINLYADLNHPSIYGAYLSALVHYKTITGNDAHNVKYRPEEISVEVDSIFKVVIDNYIN